MKCGSCGGDTARLQAEGTNPYYTRVVLTCMGCGSTTELKVEPARIEATWGENSKGAFCTGWGDEKEPAKRDRLTEVLAEAEAQQRAYEARAKRPR